MKFIRKKYLTISIIYILFTVFRTDASAQVVLGIAGGGTILENDVFGFTDQNGLLPLMSYGVFITIPINNKMAIQNKFMYDLMPYDYQGFSIDAAYQYKFTSPLYALFRITYHYNSGIQDMGIPFGGAVLYGIGIGVELKKDILIELSYNKLFEPTLRYPYHDYKRDIWRKSTLISVIHTTFKFGWTL